MLRQTPQSTSQQQASAQDPSAAIQSAESRRVLILSCGRVQRDLVSSHLSGSRFAASHANSMPEAQQALCGADFDIVIAPTSHPDGDVMAWIARIRETFPATGFVLLSDQPSYEDAAAALRCGAHDVLSPRTPSAEFIARLDEAWHRSNAVRSRQQRIVRLQDVCRKLSQARKEVTEQIGVLCDDLAAAYRELSEQVTLAEGASEFNAVVRQELDIESLLRTVLELLLARSGPTNAAIFLPSSSGDFTLGAYVNYDGPKDVAEVMLDHLASALAPKLEHEVGIISVTGRAELEKKLGNGAEWLGDATLRAFSCMQDGECLAVTILYRDQRSPFTAELDALLPLIARLFAKQLSRVIHVHHRHMPKNKWGLPGAELDDDSPDIDLAA